jgi:hypothetical protein
LLSAGSALADGDDMNAATHSPTSRELRKRRCSVIATPAFLGFGLSVRLATAAELGSRDYAHDVDR